MIFQTVSYHKRVKNLTNIKKNYVIRQHIKKGFMQKKDIEAKYYILLFSVVNFLLFEYGFFTQVIKQNKNNFIFGTLVFILGFLLVHFTNLIFLSSKKFVKFFTVLLFLANAGTLYFMNTYNVEISTSMMINLFETNFNEMIEFINIKLFLYLIFFGVVPAVSFVKIFNINYSKVQYISILKQAISIIIVAGIVLSTSIILPKYFYSLRKNKRMINYLIPVNYISSSIKITSNLIKGIFFKVNVKKISDNLEVSNLNFNDKKNLIVFVIGESARAENFSLNGYNRDTNKFLENKDIINFKNFYSCGTATFVSVPCIFSHFDRKNFSINKAKKYENVLDIFKAAGFDLYWKSNNGNCKNVCNRIKFSNLKSVNNQDYDENFVKYLNKKLKKLENKNNFIILHTRGSHGPLYSNRYPKEFEVFEPVCSSRNIDECKQNELLNAYDNSLYYSSYVLSQIIDTLKENSDKFNSVLFYVSDHGESLGENDQFMHGLPYGIANDFQKHVPFFIWVSENFENHLKINKQCLMNKSNSNLSQDNIFHSLLGLFGIKVELYNKELDIFESCRI